MDVHNWRDEVYKNIQELKDIMPVTDLHLYWINKKNPLKARKQSNHKTYKKVDLEGNDERMLVKMAAERKQMIFIRNMDDFKETNWNIEFSFNAKSALFIPIMSSKRKVLVVMEVYRSDGVQITEERSDEANEMSNVFVYIQEFVKWFSIWLSQRYKCNEEARRANFHDVHLAYQLELANKTSSYENFLDRFLKNSKEHIQADKYYLYDYNMDTKCSDFYEEIDGKLTRTATRLKFFKIGSFCDQVREKRKLIITKIDDGCELLDKEIKQDPNAILRYMIFSPLTFGEKYLGVVVFGNSQKGDQCCKFTEEEVRDVIRMSSLLANALAFRFIAQEMDRQTARINIKRQTLINLISARMRDQFSIYGNVSLPHGIDQTTWELESKNDPNQLTYICRMFNAIYNFDTERLKQFLLCVQIAHNDLPYHNIRTAFHITRTVYCIITKLNERLKPFEKASLLIAAVGYCCGHNSLDNRTMLKVGNPLTLIYRTYMKENHRVWTLSLLMKQSELLLDIPEADLINSTVNMLLLSQRKYNSHVFRQKMHNMLETGTFNLALETHASYALAIIFRVGMLGRHMQTFNVARALRDNFYDHSTALGDYGKAHGINIPDYQDSDQRHRMCKFEVKHLRSRVIPTLELMLMIFPEASFLEPMPRDTLRAYEFLVDTGNKKLWNPKVCLKKKKQKNEEGSEL